jgi:hypothetical protein
MKRQHPGEKIKRGILKQLKNMGKEMKQRILRKLRVTLN